MIQPGDRLVGNETFHIWEVLSYECTYGPLGAPRISTGKARYHPHGTTYDFVVYPEENFVRVLYEGGDSYIAAKHYSKWDWQLLEATRAFDAN